MMDFNDRIIQWLLEKENPSVRYRTLTEILEYEKTNSEVVETKQMIPESTAVKYIFSKMHLDGYWYYIDKRTGRGRGDATPYHNYVTTHYNLVNLAELGMDRTDPRIEQAVNRYLNLQQEDGDFYMHLSCLYGYVLRAFIMMGYREDDRVNRSIHLLLNSSRHDGGYLCDMHENKYKNRPVKSCVRGSVKALTAFSMLPEYWETEQCKNLTKYFLKRKIFFTSDLTKQNQLKDLRMTIFPFTWAASLLEVLNALSILGYGRRGELDEAWQVLENKKTNDGKYILDMTPSKTYFEVGKKGIENKWISFYAYLALKNRESCSTHEV